MCDLCKKNPVYEFTNKRRLCARCFIRYFQKKGLYIIRKFNMIHSGEVIGYTNSGSFRDVVLEDILRFFSEKAMVELVKLPSKKKITKKAISSTLDLEAELIIKNLITKKNSQLMESAPVIGKVIKPLYLFLDREVMLYAKLRHLKFKKKDISQDKISMFIDELERNHPEVKRAVINSYLSLFLTL